MPPEDRRDPARSPSTGPDSAILTVQDLHVTFRCPRRPDAYALRGVDLTIGRGEIVGLVGESGSGKSVLASCVLGLLPEHPAPAVTGRVLVKGADMLTSPETRRRAVRRLDLGSVFQDPMSSLDPTMRVGRQVVEAAGSVEEAVRLLTAAGIPDAESRMRVYPHELSGGLRQRVMIAMAVAGNPALIVADEPTTALDVTVQAQILRLLRRLRDDFGCSVLLITHDLGVASQVCDRLVVLYGGRLAETGPTALMLSEPRHPYTASLLRSRISLTSDVARPLPTMPGEPPRPTRPLPGCAFAPRCDLRTDDCEKAPPEPRPVPGEPGRLSACLRLDELADRPAAPGSASWPPNAVSGRGPLLTLRNVHQRFRVRGQGRHVRLSALSGVDLTVEAGESVAIVGESGSGKSTLLRAVAGLTPVSSGAIDLDGDARPQIVFQDAGASLTPWLSVATLLGERLSRLRLSKAETRRRIARTLTLVGLGDDVLHAKPGALSGGQRQRVAMARAIIDPPELLLCDEPTSALDASRAAGVLNQIGELRRELGMTVLFVTHDLGAARVVADRIAVMYLGRVVEIGPADVVVGSPAHPYTQALVSAIPEPGRAIAAPAGEAPDPLRPPSGCRFRTRCPAVRAECASRAPAPVRLDAGHLVDCLLYEERATAGSAAS
ncbi:dipeptide ABC transporter ATP-binding protein [Planotetraspora sp. GP83]|uniref:dipeptide ABC transporter ATP-binding protein n=1 Tax=Planotetraspora sp. GP83 TaxID=3156264 RepID=UPI0035196A97